jgi:phosphatidylethanolamine-binding protein (PEBP) family uncharacterized protein
VRRKHAQAAAIFFAYAIALPHNSASSRSAGLNDFGNNSYDGPCPPPGETHHYRFVVYALKQAIKPRSNKTSDRYDGALEKLASKNALAKGSLVGLFTGPDSGGGGGTDCSGIVPGTIQDQN